ncbi:ribonuclease P protein component [Kibdelosporangium philippinense]|uniref:Ribonuclease P protein component n=1 Tax=Kibdelosporangium philippinense TaxID=211113 RepID=A0ABS8ZBA9_9PSEU|nr:ribonuclease P protein component [Kibdelosporangium philippinense]MCE7005090.1 ribonuclease P protein component [Kibdelosporangium philippinense]
MLPATARLTRSGDFAHVTRHGRRAGRPRLVVHAVQSMEPTTETPLTRTGSPVRVGFVVSKAVGNSVVRHRVSRKLRHVVADRLGTLAPGSSLVVRALPPAAQASSADLAHDFDAAVRRLKLAVEQ